MTQALEWPPGRPRVLVTDAWLQNAGDAAIALSTQAMIRGLAPASSILHAAYGGAELDQYFPELQLIPALEYLIGTPWAPPVSGWEAIGSEVLEGADVVISQGGGFFIEAYEPRGRAAALAEATRRGRRIAVLGQTIGRIRGAALRRDMITFLRESPMVIVRDPASVDHAADLGAREPVLGTDMAFALPPPASQIERRGIGVVLTEHSSIENERIRRRRVAASILATVMACSGDEPVAVFSTVQGLPDLAREDDASVARDAFDSLSPGDQKRIELVDGYLPPAAVMEKIASLRVLVTMRMHPAIFAVISRTPFVLILDGQRRGVFAGSRLAERIVGTDSAEVLASAIRRAISDADTMALHADIAGLTERLGVIRDGLASLLKA